MTVVLCGESAPSLGSTITRTLTTGAGTATFKTSLAGNLLERHFPDGTSESFTYNDTGAMTGWTTPRASFSFEPNEFGEPTKFGSMASSIEYDNAGRVNLVVDLSGTHAMTYTQGQLAGESHSGGALHGQFVHRYYDSLGRLSEVELPGPGLSGTDTVAMYYDYDGTTGALSGVTTAGGVSGTWSNYDAVTGRAKSFTLGALTVTRGFDGLGRIASESSSANGVTYTYDSYAYNGDGHCTYRDTPDGSWTYGYNTYGYIQSTAGVQNLSYDFDEAGRLTSGATDYRPTLRGNSGTVNVFGSVNKLASVTINGTSVTVNGTNGHYSAVYTPPGNTWQTYVVTGSLAGAGMGGGPALAQETKSVYVPPTSESLGYDDDGNRSGDARWAFTWDDLDRLTKIVEATPQSPSLAREVDCVYDLQGRRVKKTVKVGGNVTKETTTLWDGWRPVMEIDVNSAGNTTSQRWYTWGPDVSGSMDGEGGIGGLVEIREKSGSTVTASVPIYDGIGNVVGLVDEASGAEVAHYIYGPYGELINTYGPRAESCPFRYQTKLYDSETGYCYFGKRYYDPTTISWLSRDPIREDGGINLYAYCGNDPVGSYDAIGEADENTPGWNSWLAKSEELRNSGHSLAAAWWGIWGTFRALPAAITYTADATQQGMGEARMEIDRRINSGEYGTVSAVMARGLQIVARAGTLPIQTAGHPIDTTISVITSPVTVPWALGTNIDNYLNNPSKSGAFDIVENVVNVFAVIEGGSTLQNRFPKLKNLRIPLPVRNAAVPVAGTLSSLQTVHRSRALQAGSAIIPFAELFDDGKFARLPVWRQYEIVNGSVQTPMKTTFEGKQVTVRLDNPPAGSQIIDFKAYNWSNPSYETPFIQQKVINDFQNQIKMYQTIAPNVNLQFSQPPPTWVIDAISAVGGTYSVKP